MKVLTLLLAMLSCSATWAQPKVAIALRPDVEVSAGTVTLGAVAVLQSTDLELMRALVDLPIGRAPLLGQSAVLDRDAVGDWVRRHTGLAAGDLAWNGPSVARVSAASRSIPAEQLAAVAEAALRKWLAGRSQRNEVQATTALRDVEVPPGEVRFDVRSLAHATLRERMTVWVEVWAANRFVRAVPVAFQVDAWRELPVALAPLPAGTLLREAAFAAREVNVARHGGAAFDPAGAGEGLRLRRPLAAGNAPVLRQVETAPDVLRGQWAYMRSGAGAVLTEARVEVLQDGRIGDAIRVRQPGAPASVTAVVMGPGQLEVAR